MAVKERPYIYISSENLAEANFMARNFVIQEIKNRAFINTLGAESLIKYLTNENVNVKNLCNIHSIARILEQFDIADIMMPNIHIDVRVVFDEKQIFIPKSHFEYEIQPDIYVVLKLGQNFEYFEILGFFEPKNLNFSHQNSQYYFFEEYNLASPNNLVKFIKTFSKSAPPELSEEDLAKGQELSISLADHDIDNNDLKTLIQLLVNSVKLRDSVLEYDNFETLSHRVGQNLAETTLTDDNSKDILIAPTSEEEEQTQDSLDEDSEQQSQEESDNEEDSTSEESEDTQSIGEASEIDNTEELSTDEIMPEEVVADEIATEENETIELDNSFFEENGDDLMDLTEDFFDNSEEPTETNTEEIQPEKEDSNIASDIAKTALDVTSTASTIAAAGLGASAGAAAIETGAAALASEEAINLAAIAGNEITDTIEDITEDNVENTELSEIDEIFSEDSTDRKEDEQLEQEELIEDLSEEIPDFDEDDLILDETTTTNISESLEEIKDDSTDMADINEVVNFDDLETTLNLTQETLQEPEVTTNLEDLTTIDVEEPKLEDNKEQEFEFADFSELNETTVQQTTSTQDVENYDILQEMPETTNTIEETETQTDIETAEETISFTDLDTINTVDELPAEFSDNEDTLDLQSMPSVEQEEVTDDISQTDDFTYPTDENIQDLPQEENDNTLTEFNQYQEENEEPQEDFTFTKSFEDENHTPEEIFDLTDDEPLDEIETLNEIIGEDEIEQEAQNEIKNDDFSDENYTFEDFGISDEQTPQPQQTLEASENSTVISNTEFNPGEITIDINNQEQNITDDSEHLESIYNESENFTDAALNNSSRFVRNDSGNKGSSPIFPIIVGVLVLALVGILGLSALKMFKPATQEEPQPVSDNPFPELPQPTEAENPNTLKVDKNNVVTMDNKEHAPIAQPAVKTQKTQPQNTQKLPATAFLEISKLSWEVPDYISANANFKRYFQSTGKSLKAALSSDLLLANDYIYSKQMRLSVTFDKNGSFKESRMLMSSGSTQIDKIVLQSVNHTLGVLKAPASLGNDQSTTVILKIYF